VPVLTEVLSIVLSTIAVEELPSSEYPIAEVVWPEQLEAEAESVKGEVTVLPFAGAPTLGSPDEASELAAVTVTATSATHDAPLVPHDFTCSVCPPAPADTDS
jgi:hypothetical protein